ncbi:MAG: hypothetical protein JXA41_03080 [Deltaproteobacteria bacterium]|nr:hypothetical protein [Deltaproteobacteria bacterium]
MRARFDLCNGQFIVFISIILMCLYGCASQRLNTMSTPPASHKLRVFVQPVSGDLPRGSWPVSHKEFSAALLEITANILNKKGAYDVVPEKEIRKVLGSQSTTGWQWEKQDWALAKKVGEALHADYVLVIERGHNEFLYSRMVLINTETGKTYNTYYNIHQRHGKQETSLEHKRIIRHSFREIFNLAKGDMLATAMKKGRFSMTKPLNVAEAENSEKDIKPLFGESKTIQTASPVPIDASGNRRSDRQDSSQMAVNNNPAILPPVRQAKTSPDCEEERNVDVVSHQGKTKLIIYDFNTRENLRTVAMVLAEALREELHQIGKFDLINRENMAQVMDELKLQQTGLIDEKEAIRIGKWMAANEAVTGNLAILGNAMILQAKRTDMATMTTLSVGSLKADVGEEQVFLEEMHHLAQTLAR